MKSWLLLIDDFLANKLPPKVKDAFIEAMQRYPELEKEVEYRQLEESAMDRFYQYTKDKPQDFPERFPATKLYFASLFSSALFMGTLSARLFPGSTDKTVGNRPAEERGDAPGPTAYEKTHP